MGSVLPRHSSEVSSLLRGRDPSVATFRVLLSFLCLESSPVHFPCVCHDFSGWPVCGSLCCLDLWGCVFEQMWEFWRRFPSPVGLQDSARGISAVPWPSLRLLTLCLRVHGLLSVRRSDGTSLPVGRFRPVYPSSCWELIPELCVLLFPLLALCLLCSLRFLVLGVDSSETRTLPLVMRPKVSLKPSVQLGFPFGHTPTEGGGRLPRGPCWRCRKRGAPARAWSTGGEGTATSPWAVPRGGGPAQGWGRGARTACDDPVRAQGRTPALPCLHEQGQGLVTIAVRVQGLPRPSLCLPESHVCVLCTRGPGLSVLGGNT